MELLTKKQRWATSTLKKPSLIRPKSLKSTRKMQNWAKRKGSKSATVDFQKSNFPTTMLISLWIKSRKHLALQKMIDKSYQFKKHTRPALSLTPPISLLLHCPGSQRYNLIKNHNVMTKTIYHWTRIKRVTKAKIVKKVNRLRIVSLDPNNNEILIRSELEFPFILLIIDVLNIWHMSRNITDHYYSFFIINI